MLNLTDTSPTFDDPLGMLRACHRRIEQALERIARVAELERAGPLDERARTALRQVLHYVATGVPRHAADEEESLFPRLKEARQEQACAALAHEHQALDAAHAELEALGQALLRAGRFVDAADRERFSQVIAFLNATYAAHIRVEDDEVFPAAAEAVAADDLDRIGAEMAARRGIDWEQRRQVLQQLDDRPWLKRA
jgi:hemerythrin-like domain-containing protein